MKHSCPRNPPNMTISVGNFLSNVYIDSGLCILYRQVINESGCAEEFYYDVKNRDCKFCGEKLY